MLKIKEMDFFFQYYGSMILICFSYDIVAVLLHYVSRVPLIGGPWGRRREREEARGEIRISIDLWTGPVSDLSDLIYLK